MNENQFTASSEFPVSACDTDYEAQARWEAEQEAHAERKDEELSLDTFDEIPF